MISTQPAAFPSRSDFLQLAKMGVTYEDYFLSLVSGKIRKDRTTLDSVVKVGDIDHETWDHNIIGRELGGRVTMHQNSFSLMQVYLILLGLTQRRPTGVPAKFLRNSNNLLYATDGGIDNVIRVVPKPGGKVIIDSHTVEWDNPRHTWYPDGSKGIIRVFTNSSR